MTSNIAESVNSLFGNEREFSIKGLFEVINKKYGPFFNIKRVQFEGAGTPFVLEIEKIISTNISLGNRLLSHQIADYKFSMNGHGDVTTVDL